MKAADRNQYEVPDPKELSGYIEFRVDSASSNPHMAGPIDIRVEPERLGIRWAGERKWNYVEYADLAVIADCLPQRARELLKEKFELAVEDGLRCGLQEAEVDGTASDRPSKLFKMPVKGNSDAVV